MDAHDWFTLYRAAESSGELRTVIRCADE